MVINVVVLVEVQPAWAQLYMQRQVPPRHEMSVASYGAKAVQHGVDPSQNWRSDGQPPAPLAPLPPVGVSSGGTTLQNSPHSALGRSSQPILMTADGSPPGQPPDAQL